MNNFSLITVTGFAAVAAALYYILFGPKQGNSKPTKGGNIPRTVDIFLEIGTLVLPTILMAMIDTKLLSTSLVWYVNKS